MTNAPLRLTMELIRLRDLTFQQIFKRITPQMNLICLNREIFMDTLIAGLSGNSTTKPPEEVINGLIPIS